VNSAITLLRQVFGRRRLPIASAPRKGCREGNGAIPKCRVLAIVFFVSVFAVVEDSSGQTSTTSSSISLDTVKALHQDTIPVVTPSSVVADSMARFKKMQDSMLTPKKPGAGAKTGPAADTISRFLTHPYFGVGIGWGLGSFPVLTQWQNAVPDSAGAILPLNPDTLGFTITEPVNTYNILFPIYLSYTPFVYSRSSVAFEGSFFFIDKSLQATLQHDTSLEKINYQQSMTCYGFTAGVFYRRQIGERYFRIEKVDKTCFILGVSVLPYFHLSKSESISAADVSDSVISAARARLQNFHAWGMGGAWRIGISTQQSLSQTSGMEISLSYIGRYAGEFRKNGAYLLNKDIDPSAENPGSKLSSLSSTVEIRLDFLFGKKQM
jgi:hypothetical protein